MAIKLEWNVYYPDWNGKTIKTFNIFKHSGFRKDVEKYLKKYEDKDEFAKQLKGSLMYYFWLKCEWEVVITEWAPHITMRELDRLNAEREKTLKEYNRDPYSLYVSPDIAIKIDVYDQVMNNWEIFLDYCWSNKPAKRNRRNGKCAIEKGYCTHLSNGYCIADEKAFNNCPYLQFVAEIARRAVLDD